MKEAEAQRLKLSKAHCSKARPKRIHPNDNSPTVGGLANVGKFQLPKCKCKRLHGSSCEYMRQHLRQQVFATLHEQFRGKRASKPIHSSAIPCIACMGFHVHEPVTVAASSSLWRCSSLPSLRSLHPFLHSCMHFRVHATLRCLVFFTFLSNLTRLCCAAPAFLFFLLRIGLHFCSAFVELLSSTRSSTRWRSTASN